MELPNIHKKGPLQRKKSQPEREGLLPDLDSNKKIPKTHPSQNQVQPASRNQKWASSSKNPVEELIDRTSQRPKSEKDKNNFRAELQKLLQGRMYKEARSKVSSNGEIHEMALAMEGRLMVLALGDYKSIIEVHFRKTVNSPFQLVAELEGHKKGMDGIVVTPDGGTIISGSDDHTLKVWTRLPGGAEDKPVYRDHQTLEGHDGWIGSVSMTSDQSTIVSASEDNTIRVWEDRNRAGEEGGMPNFECVQVLRGHSDAVYYAKISPDGTTIVSGSSDTTVRVWERDQGNGSNGPSGSDFYCAHELSGHNGRVFSVGMSLDNTLIVSGSDDQTARVWTKREAGEGETEGYDCLQVLEGHAGGIRGVAVTPNGNKIFTGSADSTVRIWDKKIGERGDLPAYCCIQVIDDHQDWVRSLYCSPDGNTLFTGSDDRIIRIWTAGEGGAQVNFDQDYQVLEGHTKSVRSISATPDGRTVVTGSFDKKLGIWAPKTEGRQESTGLYDSVRMVATGHSKIIREIAMTPDGGTIVSGSEDGTLKVWAKKRGEGGESPSYDCVQVLEGHEDHIPAVAITPDARMVLSGSRDKTLKLWLRKEIGEGEAPSYDCIQTLEHPDTVESISVTPDAGIIAAGSKDTVLRIFVRNKDSEPHPRYTCTQELRDHSGFIRGVSMTPDGMTIVTGAEDNTVRVWTRKNSTDPSLPLFACIQELRGHVSSIRCISVTDDAAFIFTGSDDKTVRVWARHQNSYSFLTSFIWNKNFDQKSLYTRASSVYSLSIGNNLLFTTDEKNLCVT